MRLNRLIFWGSGEFLEGKLAFFITSWFSTNHAIGSNSDRPFERSGQNGSFMRPSDLVYFQKPVQWQKKAVRNFNNNSDHLETHVLQKIEKFSKFNYCVTYLINFLDVGQVFHFNKLMFFIYQAAHKIKARSDLSLPLSFKTMRLSDMSGFTTITKVLLIHLESNENGRYINRTVQMLISNSV